MFQDAAVAPWPEVEDPPTCPRYVLSDIDWILVYRAGFHDGADGRGPFRDAEAYRSGWSSGTRFRAAVSGARRYPVDHHFPGWTTGDVMNTTGDARGGFLPLWLRFHARGGVRGAGRTT